MYVQTNLHSHATPVPGLPAGQPIGRSTPLTVYPAQGMIYAQGDEVGTLYQVEFGAVRLCRLTMDGRRQISAFILPGEIFGLDAHSEHHFYAETTTETGLKVIGRKGEMDRLDMTRLALEGLTRAQEHLLVLGRQNALERIAAFLLDLCERQDNEEHVVLPMLRNDIADYLGLTFETVSRVFGKLKSQRIIRLINTRDVEILDYDALVDLAS